VVVEGGPVPPDHGGQDVGLGPHADAAFHAGKRTVTKDIEVAHGWDMPYHLGMSITIDKAGRIVVPKALRERYALHPGAELEIEATADGIRLRPRGGGEAFVMKDGVLVHHGPSIAAGLDVTAFINRQRDERALDRGGRSS